MAEAVTIEDGEKAIIVQEPEANAEHPEALKADDSSEQIATPVAPQDSKALEAEVEAAAQVDTPDVPSRFVEKKRLVWTDKTCKPA